MSRAHRARCGMCGRSRPEEETALVPGRVGGDYRRSSRRGTRRVCRACVVERIEYVRPAQTEGRNTPLDEHRISWSRAADFFGIDVSDLYKTARTTKPEPT